ncbi:recombinase family protein [Clostridium sp. BL-8]|uniref:recombinase family protein n=1 Tax=Clostridium sp. BL-8 TaxID=349938 RepID=UPI00098C3337|nr:recombinase family protein [Clostridium sp. BL-8]OOM67942.1 transposon gamma-delta resolvase [Clostridium sp. BL-8]
MIYKYERISIRKQSVGRQEMVFDKLGITFDKTYSNKISRKSIDRPALNKLKLEVNNDDIIYCESISMLGRNVDDLRRTCDYFKNKGVTVYFVKERINTEGDGYKFILTILGAVAEMERENTVERVQQGVTRCIETGTTKTGRWFGREEKKAENLPKEFKKYYIKMINKELSKVEMVKLLDCGRATLYRWIKLYKEKE